MIQLVYASAATQPFTPRQLAVLLGKARSRNMLYSVTGMLLYHGGSFLQVLEGPEAGVDTVLASISRDARHRGTKVLHRGTIAQREFKDWAMGFADTSELGSSVPGMVDYYRTLPRQTDGAGEARRFLRFFQDGLCRQGTLS